MPIDPPEELLSAEVKLEEYRLRRRDTLVDSYDRILLTLSAAALTLSVAFADRLLSGSESTQIWLLFLGWGALFGSIVLLLVSYVRAVRSFDGPPVAFSEDKAWKMSVWAGALFLFALMAILVFAGINLH